MKKWIGSTTQEVPKIEHIRKVARILVIDDHVYPFEKNFQRDGYHFERWAEIKNLSQLTDGHYHLILLDIQGVGLNDSPDKQGLGILEHIKASNPSQAVILYSATPQSISNTHIQSMADAVFDKRQSYVEYKKEVDRILLSRATPASFIATMNQLLGEDAFLAPNSVKLATKAIKRGNPKSLSDYLQGKLVDPKQVDAIIGVIGSGIKLVIELNSGK